MEFQENLPDLLAELEACRISRGMSRQAVADACGVSVATISRTFKGTVEPSYQLVQAIVAAVQYKPALQEIVPADYTQEAYIAYLREQIQRQHDESDLRVRQLQTHYNMLRRQDRRTIIILGLLLGMLVLFICLLFLYDFAHLDRGWIQEMVSCAREKSTSFVEFVKFVGGNLGELHKM